MRISWWFRLAGAPALALIAACGSSTDPGPALAGSYVLRTVAGESLPAVLSSNEFYEVRVFADTLRLRPGRTGTLLGVEDARSLLAPRRRTAGVRHYCVPLSDQRNQSACDLIRLSP